jgi:LmbE family N-acetylglucosaminyl deacetylase
MMNNESQRVLVVVAHPDDPEYFCGATLAKWAREGKAIHYLVLTCGEKGSDDPAMTPEKICAMRQAEQRAAAQVIGVHKVHFLDYPDGELANAPAVRRDIVRELRRVRPQIVITTDPTTYLIDQRWINHVDHRIAGLATLEAVMPAAANRFYFPELLTEGLTPYLPHQVWLCLTNTPNHKVDVTQTIEVKVAALLEHKSQVHESREELIVQVRGRRRRFFWHADYEKFLVLQL